MRAFVEAVRMAHATDGECLSLIANVAFNFGAIPGTQYLITR